MKFEFENNSPVDIPAANPVAISSRIDVTNVNGKLENVTVSLDIDHTYTNDLRIALVAPNGQRVVLVDREGGSGNNFHNTTFDDRSTSSIRRALPPFTGRFSPDQPLSEFQGIEVNGPWTLEVNDAAALDGGILQGWSLNMMVDQGIRSEFEIGVRFLGGLTRSQRDIFESAAARWSEVIIGDLPQVGGTDIGTVDDVVIDAQGESIDGAGRILGQAAPTLIRSNGFLPIRGTMSFDTADLAQLEANGGLFNVIVHEMGHVLGMGTLWGRLGLVRGIGSSNPTFLGRNANREFRSLIGGVSRGVPVENMGGPGTAGGHWRETVFGHELMTGFLDPGVNPISRMTIAALQDMGYVVNPDAADRYSLPGSRLLSIMGADAPNHPCCGCGNHNPTAQVHCG
jgi:subtilisin-like proprotein convertase family protein